MSTRLPTETGIYLKTFAYLEVQCVVSFLVTSNKNVSYTSYFLVDLHCVLLTYFYMSHCTFAYVIVNLR